MTRIRTIKPEFFTDETIAQLPPLYRLAFAGLWCQADKAGRLEDRPARLKVMILPYDDVDFGDALRVLAAAKFVTRYTGPDGRGYLQIRSFEKHQRPRPDEPDSELPEPQGDTDTDTSRTLRSDVSDTWQSSPSIPPPSVLPSPCTPPQERKGKERKGKEESSEPRGDSKPTDASPTAFEFKVVGVDGAIFRLSEAQVAEWAALFPALDVRQEMRNALAWVLANPGRRKTARGMPKFLVSWLTRSNDRGHNASGANRSSMARAPASAGLYAVPDAETTRRKYLTDGDPDERKPTERRTG